MSDLRSRFGRWGVGVLLRLCGSCVACPKGAKVSNYRVFGVSIFGIVIMVLGRYLIVGYLVPLGLFLRAF